MWVYLKRESFNFSIGLKIDILISAFFLLIKLVSFNSKKDWYFN